MLFVVHFVLVVVVLNVVVVYLRFFLLITLHSFDWSSPVKTGQVILDKSSRNLFFKKKVDKIFF